MKTLVLYSGWYRNFGRMDEKSIKEFISRLKDAHFDGLELSIDYPIYFKSNVHELIADYLRHEGLYLGIHLPWRDIELASPIEEVRISSLNTIVKCMNSLSNVRPKYYVLHLTTEQDYCGYMNRDCVNAAVKSLNIIVKNSTNLGIPTLIETTFERCCSNEETLPYVLSGIEESSYLNICLDPIHLISRRVRMWGKPETIEELINALPPIMLERTEEIHVHNYRVLGYGITYAHLIPDEDILQDFIGVIKRLRNRVKVVTLEVYKDLSGKDIDISALKEIVVKLKNYLR